MNSDNESVNRRDDKEEKRKECILGIEIDDIDLANTFTSEQIEKMREYEKNENNLKQSLKELRVHLNVQNRRIPFACSTHLFKQTKEGDSLCISADVSDRYPLIVSSFLDNHSFYRSFMVSFLFNLLFKAPVKNVFKFLKKI